jgi:hypothetical protein
MNHCRYIDSDIRRGRRQRNLLTYTIADIEFFVDQSLEIREKMSTVTPQNANDELSSYEIFPLFLTINGSPPNITQIRHPPHPSGEISRSALARSGVMQPILTLGRDIILRPNLLD